MPRLYNIDWNDMRAVQTEITRWASTNWPDRTYHQALSKVVLEEIPEMLQHHKEKGTAGIGTELADIFILLMDLASIWQVDLPKAIMAKMEINYGRMWLRDPTTGIAQHVDAKHKPIGNPVMDADDSTVDMLLVSGYFGAEVADQLDEAVKNWTEAEKVAAQEWAAAVHCSASDNDDVEVPPIPPLVQDLINALPRPSLGVQQE